LGVTYARQMRNEQGHRTIKIKARWDSRAGSYPPLGRAGTKQNTKLLKKGTRARGGKIKKKREGKSKTDKYPSKTKRNVCEP